MIPYNKSYVSMVSLSQNILYCTHPCADVRHLHDERKWGEWRKHGDVALGCLSPSDHMLGGGSSASRPLLTSGN